MPPTKTPPPIAALVMALAVLAGSGPGFAAGTAPTPTEPPRAASGSPPPSIVPPETREESLSYTSPDGVIQKGTLVLPESASGSHKVAVALLVHSYAADRDTMLPLSQALARRGIGSLLFDLRGHGKSRVTTDNRIYTFPLVPLTELHKVRSDIEAFAALAAGHPGVDPANLFVVGVAEGAVFAAGGAGKSPLFRAVAMIDPSEPVGGIDPTEQLSLIGQRPVLLISSGFEGSKRRCERYAEFGSGPRVIESVASFERNFKLVGAGSPTLEIVSAWVAAQSSGSP